VRGVEVRREGRGRERLHADLVVGADGRNSTIAKVVGAEEYLAYQGPRACYWAYWRRPADWNPNELCNFYRGDDAYVVFPTDGDELLIASAPPVERARAWRGDHRNAYLASVASHEPISSHLDEDLPVSEVRGVLKTNYFFRTSAGPGWTLIGDAGHHKEFFLGLGISDALRDAHKLSLAILGSGPAAIEAWWRARDIERIEFFHWGRELGRADPVDALRRLTAQRLPCAPHLQGRLGEIIDGRLSPFNLVPAHHAVGWVAASILRGDPSPLPPLVAAVHDRIGAKRELRRRTRALRRVQRAHVSHTMTPPETLSRPPASTAIGPMQACRDVQNLEKWS
jgi:2-polyprenyl-6-methoxyphenol hydroxylase and related FAD-dependent oxidoreductases